MMEIIFNAGKFHLFDINFVMLGTGTYYEMVELKNKLKDDKANKNNFYAIIEAPNRPFDSNYYFINSSSFAGIVMSGLTYDQAIEARKIFAANEPDTEFNIVRM